MRVISTKSEELQAYARTPAPTMSTCRGTQIKDNNSLFSPDSHAEEVGADWPDARTLPKSSSLVSWQHIVFLCNARERAYVLFYRKLDNPNEPQVSVCFRQTRLVNQRTGRPNDSLYSAARNSSCST